MGILEEKESHLQWLQGPVASFAVTGKRRRIAGQDTQRSANLINACRSSQHLSLKHTNPGVRSAS